MINQLPPSLSAVTDDEGPDTKPLNGIGGFHIKNVRGPLDILPLPDDEGIAKENEDGWDILICQSCGQDVGRGRPGAGVTILKCVPCSQLSTETLRAALSVEAPAEQTEKS